MTRADGAERGTGGANGDGPLFPRRTLAVLVAVAGLSFTGLLLLGGFGERLGGPVTAGPGAYSVSALGHAGLAEFLRGAGVAVVPRRDASVARPGTQAPLVLVEPAAAAGLDDLFEEARAAGAPVVLVLPKRSGIPDPGRPRWIARSATKDLASVRAVLGAAMDAWWAAAMAEQEEGEARVAPTVPKLDRRAGRLDGSCRSAFGRDLRVAIEDPQLLAATAGVTALVACDGGTLVARVASEPGAAFYVVADPDLLSNHGLGAAEHASIAEALFAGEMRTHAAVFDETIHGLAARPGLIEEFLSFPLVIVTLHALLLAGLAVWTGAERFGRPRRATAALAAGKEALIDCAAQLAAARRLAGPAASAFARARQRSLARTLGLTGTLAPGPGLADRIDEVLRARRLPARAREHWNSVETAAAGPAGAPAKTERAVLAATTALHDWMQEIADGTRRDP